MKRILSFIKSMFLFFWHEEEASSCKPQAASNPHPVTSNPQQATINPQPEPAIAEQKTNTMTLIYADKITANQTQFIDKLYYICNKLSIDPNWLMYVIGFETGFTFSPKAQNSKTGATGLIQFLPSTAAYLGTTTADLMQMSNVEQLDYVYKYLKPYSGDMENLVDVYLAVFFPAAIGKTADYVFQTSKLSASKIASQNPVFDLNLDGMITYGEVEAKILSGVPSNYQSIMEKKKLL